MQFCSLHLSEFFYFLQVSLLLVLPNPRDVDDDEDDILDLSFSSLSSLNALHSWSWSSLYLLFFRSRSSAVPLPRYAKSDKSSASMILLSTSEHLGKKRFPRSTAHQQNGSEYQAFDPENL